MQKVIDPRNPWNESEILECLAEAGKISMHYWRKNDLHTEFKSDTSPVTEGDTCVEKTLAGYFDHPELGSYMIGEETVESRDEAYIQAALNAPCTWVVDPIDGTAPYSNRLPMFGTAIGLMQYGKITHGAMFMPYFGDLYITRGDQLMMARNIPENAPLRSADLVPVHPTIPPDGMIVLSQLMAKRGAYLGKERVQSICSCVYTLGNLFAGHYKAFIGCGKIWDFVFALAMCQRLNAPIYGLDAKPLPFDIHALFATEADAPNRWQARQQIIIALSDELARYVAQNVRLDTSLTL